MSMKSPILLALLLLAVLAQGQIRTEAPDADRTPFVFLSDSQVEAFDLVHSRRKDTANLPARAMSAK